MSKKPDKAKSYFEPAKIKAKRYEEIIDKQLYGEGHKFTGADQAPKKPKKGYRGNAKD